MNTSSLFRFYDCKIWISISRWISFHFVECPCLALENHRIPDLSKPARVEEKEFQRRWDPNYNLKGNRHSEIPHLIQGHITRRTGVWAQVCLLPEARLLRFSNRGIRSLMAPRNYKRLHSGSWKRIQLALPGPLSDPLHLAFWNAAASQIRSREDSKRSPSHLLYIRCKF